MRCPIFVSLALAGMLLSACGPRPGGAKEEVLYRHRFSGLADMAGREDLARVREVLALPETQAVIQDATRKLAASMPGWFGRPVLGTNDALVYQPLIRAILDSENRLEVRVREGKVSGWALAVRMDSGSAALATAGEGLRRLVGVPAGAAPQEAFELKSEAGGPSAVFQVHQGWMVMGVGAPVVADVVRGLGTSPGSNTVFEVETDLDRVARLVGLREKPPGPVDQWPAVRLQVAPRNGLLRTTASLNFARALGFPLEAWQMPTNVLRDPIVGFTAARGASNWLSRLGLFADLGVTEWPQQLFLWSVAGDPWLQYFAAPIQAPTNLMAQISLTLPVRAVTNMLWSESIFALRITNQARRVELRGLPYFAPFMEAQRVESGEQLFGGLFPHTVGSRPAPAGLLQQVAGRTNLVLYDWETTGRRILTTNPPGVAGPRVMTNDIGRLVQFKHLSQFARLMLSRDPLRLPSAGDGVLLIPGSRWVDAALPLLRDTVTEVTLNSPTELSATRQSVTGFNALELLYLLRWIDNPGFPGWKEVPPPAPRTRPAGPPVPGAPSAPGAPGAASPPVKAPGTP